MDNIINRKGVAYQAIPFSLNKAIELRNLVVTRGTNTEVEWQFFETMKSQPIAYAYKEDVLTVDRYGRFRSEMSPLDLIILEPIDKSYES